MHTHCKLLLLQKEGLLLFLKKEGRFKFYFPSSWEGTKSARPSYGGRQWGWKGGNCFKKKKKRRRTPCCLTWCGGCNIPGRGCTGGSKLFEALTPSIQSLAGASPMESWATSRLWLTRDALGARGAGWVPGRGVPRPEAGLGQEGKRILSPLPLAARSSHREPQLTARPGPDCPVLPVPETQLAEEQNKTTQSPV